MLIAQQFIELFYLSGRSHCNYHYYRASSNLLLILPVWKWVDGENDQANSLITIRSKLWRFIFLICHLFDVFTNNRFRVDSQPIYKFDKKCYTARVCKYQNWRVKWWFIHSYKHKTGVLGGYSCEDLLAKHIQNIYETVCSCIPVQIVFIPESENRKILLNLWMAHFNYVYRCENIVVSSNSKQFLQ